MAMLFWSHCFARTSHDRCQPSFSRFYSRAYYFLVFAIEDWLLWCGQDARVVYNYAKKSASASSSWTSSIASTAARRRSSAQEHQENNASSPRLELRVDESTGAFRIWYGGELWFSGGEYMLTVNGVRHTASSGDLVLLESRKLEDWTTEPALPGSSTSPNHEASASSRHQGRSVGLDAGDRDNTQANEVDMEKIQNKRHKSITLGWGVRAALSERVAKDDEQTKTSIAKEQKRVLMYTIFRYDYEHDDSLILFEQVFPEKINVYPADASSRSANDNCGEPNSDEENHFSRVSTLFPGFVRPRPTTSSIHPRRGNSVNLDGAQSRTTAFMPSEDENDKETAKDFPFFSYGRVFARMYSGKLSTYREKHQGGAPLISYDYFHDDKIQRKDHHDQLQADQQEVGSSSTAMTAPSSRSSKIPAKMKMVVFSPLSSVKAQHMGSSDRFFGAGIKREVELIPAGWTQVFMLSASDKGINRGMMRWGDRFLELRGVSKERRRAKRRRVFNDGLHNSVGYWTDNGGYYHYSLGNDTSLGSDYESVLPKVQQYHFDKIENEGFFRFRHWQFDSWFYPKDGGGDRAGGYYGGVRNWTALEAVFPRGMPNIQKKLHNMPMILHNRQWSVESDYVRDAELSEKYPWYLTTSLPCDPTQEKKVDDVVVAAGSSAPTSEPENDITGRNKTYHFAMPEDPAAFFKWFFQQQQGWGLQMYEQDWMCAQYNYTSVLQTNISMGDLWLSGLAEGAASQNVAIQYCMPYTYDVLAGASLDTVTNVRATGDYFHAKHQWAIGGTSLLYWALNILPFKDAFYSSSLKQVGGENEGPEKHPDREALMATLSCAMVGPQDGINLLNATRVAATCRKDGVILKPDRPLTTTDSCFSAARPETCFVYSTYSDIPGNYGRVYYYFNNENEPPDHEFRLASAEEHLDALLMEERKLDEAKVHPMSRYVVYDWYNRNIALIRDHDDRDHRTKSSRGEQDQPQDAPSSRKNENFRAPPVSPGYEGHVYAVAVPVISGWLFLGEVEKFVTASSWRFSKVEVTSSSGLMVSVFGVEGEIVTICAAKLLNLHNRKKNEDVFEKYADSRVLDDHDTLVEKIVVEDQDELGPRVDMEDEVLVVDVVESLSRNDSSSRLFSRSDSERRANSAEASISAIGQNSNDVALGCVELRFSTTSARKDKSKTRTLSSSSKLSRSSSFLYTKTVHFQHYRAGAPTQKVKPGDVEIVEEEENVEVVA